MSEYISNNKRIAKNTILLYCRMLLTMLVSLYTSRVVLKELGVEDYGIYNVVGGLVAMFSMLSNSLSTAISRFITFELGLNDIGKLKRIFSSAIMIQSILAIIIVILAETVGLWFLNTRLDISNDRLNAANWVYHFSVITFAIQLITIPYNASIIAHEKMSAFAYISILEVIAKLTIALSLAIISEDRLIYYGLSLMVMTTFVCLVYIFYCKRRFNECEFHLLYDCIILKRMFSFAGWNFIGAASSVLRDQGGNIIINIFYGSTVNAARGVAMQVSHAVQGFVSNFMTALNPQITKSYAVKNYDYMMSLIFQGARFSFYILLLLSLPIILNTHYILSLWLESIPEFSVVFVRCVLIFVMSESLANPLITAMIATGDIRNYQLIVGGLQILNLPISYICLRFGYPPQCIFIVAIIISFCCEIARLIMLRFMINLPMMLFLRKVYINVIMVSVIAIILPSLVVYNISENFVNFSFTTLLSMVCTLLSIYYVGCDRKERMFITNKFREIIIKLIKRNDRN